MYMRMFSRPSIGVFFFLVFCAPAFAQDADRKQGRVFENSIGMKLVLIPAGEFQMGSPADEKQRKEDEFSHAVRILGYACRELPFSESQLEQA